MVDPISSAATGRIRSASGAPVADTSSERQQVDKVSKTASISRDQVQLGSSGTSAVVSDLVAKGPPFDFDTVERIKKAIENGTYPIDVDKITRHLFDSHDDIRL